MKRKKLTYLQIFFAGVILTLLFKISFLTPVINDKNAIYPKREYVFNEINIPILIYHYVEYNKDERDFIRDSLNIQPHVFEKQIITLKNAGYTFITPGDIPFLFKDPKTLSNRFVILSFDDGYRDFYTDVLPILRRHNVKAVNYVIYNSLDKQNYMTKKQIKEVLESGLVEIGSHTLSHPRLTHIDIELMRNEIVLSKAYLENEFNISVESFAYPYGAYNNSVVSTVKEAGYTNAVSDEIGSLVSRDDYFTIFRLRPGYLTGADLISHLESGDKQ